MTFKIVQYRPGVNSIPTPTANEGGISSSNLIRWRQGRTERIGGWERLSNTTADATIRALHVYRDLGNIDDLLVGTDSGPQLYIHTTNTWYDFFISKRTSSTFPSAFIATSTIEQYGGVVAVTGSTTVTVNDSLTNFQGGSLASYVAVGDQFIFPVSTSIGSVVVYPSEMFTVLAVSDSSLTFNMLTAALATGATKPQITYDSFNNSTTVFVYFPGHGLSNGQMFTAQVDTIWANNQFIPGQTVKLPAGVYTVSNVSGPNFEVMYDNNLGTGLPFSISSSFFLHAEGWNFANVTTTAVLTLVTAIFETPVISYEAPTISSDRPVWFLDNLGQDGLFLWQNGPIYVWKPPLTIGDQILTNISDTDAPQLNAGMFVAMPQAQIIAFGSSAILGTTTTGQDPLLLRWCHAGDYTIWTAASENQAGSFRLSRGSKIMGGKQAPQTTLLWTDIDLWSMQYIGPPLVYGFSIVGSGCGLIAPHAMGTLGRVTYWMSQKQFYMFDGSVNALPCPIWDDVFLNLNEDAEQRIFCGINSAFDEVMWFFPSTGQTECDMFVKYSASERAWDLGELVRTAWIDQNVLGMPLASDANFRIQQHDVGYNDDGSPITGAYVETAYAEISDGDYIIFCDFCIPDFKWLGSGGQVNITVYTVNYPSDTPRVYGPFQATPTKPWIPVRLRGRQVKIKFEWDDQLNFNARLGAVRFRVAPAGRRP